MALHTVCMGEWVGSIAAKEGYSAWKPIWNHANNASIRAQRPEPNLLVEGDVIYVPPVVSKQESGSTTATHVFKLNREENKLVVQIVRVERYLQVFGPISFTLTVGKNSISGEISTEGQKVEISLGLAVEQGTLTLGGTDFPLLVGALHPIDRLSGMQGRLYNVGFDAGPIDNMDGPLTSRGTRDFQAFCGISVDGVIGPVTRGKMKEIYGC